MTELQELLDACIRQEIFPGIKEKLEYIKSQEHAGKLSKETRGLLIRKLKQALEKNASAWRASANSVKKEPDAETSGQ